MMVIIAGASGLVGRALRQAFEVNGHRVRTLVRRSPKSDSEIPWNPGVESMDARALEGVDAIVNLAGENIGAGRWSEDRRERILRSRVHATRTLVEAMSRIAHRPRVFISASAVGAYGDRGDEVVTELAPLGHGFLAGVCRAWEAEAENAARLDVRVVILRLGIVLAPRGGALARMLPLFRLGLGGRLGSGRQWMSWVHVDDVAAVSSQALADERYAGPLNIVAPAPVSNAEFTSTLARVLHRSAHVPAPAWALRAAFGRMADEALLASTRADPARLRDLGYTFQHPVLEPALRDVVSRSR